MADVKTADKTVKHIGQDATDMAEAMKGVQAPCSARLLRGMFAGLFTGLFVGLFTGLHAEASGQKQKSKRQKPQVTSTTVRLPETEHVLHPQAHARNSKAAAETEEDRLAA